MFPEQRVNYLYQFWQTGGLHRSVINIEWQSIQGVDQVKSLFQYEGTVFDFIVVHSISGPPFIPTGFELLRYNRDYVISILKFLSLKKTEPGEYF